MTTEATLECTWPIQSWVQAGFKMSAWASPGKKSTMWTKQRLLVNACRTNLAVKSSHKHSQKPHKTWTFELSAPAHLITWDILLRTETHINLPLKKNFKNLKKRRERKMSKYKTKFNTDGKSLKQSASVLLSWCLRSAVRFLFLFTGLWGLLLEVLS